MFVELRGLPGVAEVVVDADSSIAALAKVAVAELGLSVRSHEVTLSAKASEDVLDGTANVQDALRGLGLNDRPLHVVLDVFEPPLHTSFLGEGGTRACGARACDPPCYAFPRPCPRRTANDGSGLPPQEGRQRCAPCC